MIKQLILISDINGWCIPEHQLSATTSSLINGFHEVYRHSSLTLAGIDDIVTREERHRQLIEKGIDVAAEQLVTKYTAGVTCGIGFSVGGVILWRAALKGLKIDNLLCFSSTRLRFENEKPNSRIRLHFGEHDIHAPDATWLTTIGIEATIIRGAGHDFYLSDTGSRILEDELPLIQSAF